MNFRKLLTYLTVGTAAVIPFAGAQNPTILQGSYISNVFGNSNFVKNPNAQTNVANVTNATRSTTTPLVATSEFNLSLDAGQNATWTLRTFDAGMKGQNCEARFSYRGFATATTTAEIVQNSLVVAQLVLTPSTDPRIASINFPCGDLANATTFRIAQTTANMTGTNEIGAIYTGLATNMANVAQAEIVARIYLDGCTGEPSTTLTSFSDLSGGACSTTTINGDNVSFDTATGQLTVTNAKPGRYVLDGLSFYGVGTTTSSDLQARWLESTSNIASGVHYIATLNVASGSVYTSRMPQGSWEFTNTATRIFKPQIRLGNNTNVTAGKLQYTGGQSAGSLVLTRFPTSSELVVTPERQNTFAGIKGVATANTNSVTSASWTKLTAGSTLTRTSYGKAKVESNDDYSITIENLPVGSYYVTTTAFYAALSSASGDQTSCFFALADSATGGAQIGSMQTNATGDATLAAQTGPGSTIGGVYTNTSVANRTFFVQTYRAGGSGSCVSYSDSNRPVTISVIPLDQPSNSALYVEGPVKAAATGAAIPAGYVGETIQSVVEVASAATNTGATAGTLTNLPAGVWSMQVFGSVINATGVITSGSFYGIATTNCSLNPAGTQGYNEIENSGYMQGYTFDSANTVRSTATNSRIVTVTAPTTYCHRVAFYTVGGGTVGFRGYIRAVRIN